MSIISRSSGVVIHKFYNLHWATGQDENMDKCSDHIDCTLSRYRSRIRRAYDIVVAIYRTILCTNAHLARALLTYRSSGICIWLTSLAVHNSPWLPSCLTFPGVDLSCSALGAWGGDWGTTVAPVVG